MDWGPEQKFGVAEREETAKLTGIARSFRR